MKFRILILITIEMLCISNFVYAYCSTELKSQENNIHVSVQKCTNIGTFSIGALYRDRWEKLTYNYPRPWEGTFLSIKVNNRVYCNSKDVGGAIFMDPYVIEGPRIKENEIITRWRLPENLIVEEVLELIANGTRIYIILKNENEGDLYVGARLHIDTMLGENDGAPIYIPGDGLRSKEKVYSGKVLNFDYWKAFNREENASVIASGMLRGGILTYPDKFIVAYWKKSMHSAWDYEIDPERSILGDSAVIIFYNPIHLESGEGRGIITIYKNGEPILGRFGIADFVVDRENDSMNIKVDVISKENRSRGYLRIEVRDENGTLIYIENKSTGILENETSRTIEFKLNISDSLEGGMIDVKASLYKGGEVVDTIEKNISLNESEIRTLFKIVDINEKFMQYGIMQIHVDIISIGTINNGILKLDILNSDGYLVFSESRESGDVKSHQIKTLKFDWNLSEISDGKFTIMAYLFSGNKLVDEFGKNITVNTSILNKTEIIDSAIPEKTENASIIEKSRALGLRQFFDIIIVAIIVLLSVLYIFYRLRERREYSARRRKLRRGTPEINMKSMHREIHEEKFEPGREFEREGKVKFEVGLDRLKKAVKKATDKLESLQRRKKGLEKALTYEEIRIEKSIDGKRIRIVIENNSDIELRNCILEDKLERGSTILVSDIDVIGNYEKLMISEGNKLIWKIGNLPPKSRIELGYSLVVPIRKKIPHAKLIWDSGEKESTCFF